MVSFHMAIVKFILALGLRFSRPQLNHILNFVHGIILSDGKKTVSNICRASNEPCHLSSMTRFLNESPWNHNRLTRRRLQKVVRSIQKKRAQQGDTRPIVFFIVDDTQSKRDRSTKKMEGLDAHFSHSDGKTVWSHCVVTAHVVSEELSFAWNFRSYFRKTYCEENGLPFKSKNDLAIELINEYESSAEEQVYVLVDSWYTSKKVIDACAVKGFQLIGGLRTNRKIYPQGIGIQISKFASQFMNKSDTRPVTAGDDTYNLYTYEGKLSDIENAKILVSWENGFDASKKPFCILCTDCSLDVVTILRYYDVRWNIETGYRFFKDLLGFDEYQLLSRKGIERFWCIQFLTYNFLEYQRLEWQQPGNRMTIGDVVRRIRKDNIGQIVVYAYEQALANKPLADVLKHMKLNAA